MIRIKPKPIVPGSFLSVIAPSSQINRDWLAQGEEKLRKFGLGLTYSKLIYKSHRFWAGTDAERTENFLEELEREDTVGLWCARGGYGAVRILEALDRANVPARLKNNRKLLIGYSDSTALHFYFWKSAQISALHAPLMATPSWLRMKKNDVKNLLQLISGQIELGKTSYTTKWRTKFLSAPGECEGTLLGGNLSVLCTLIGTPWLPKLEDAILFLEDCNEAPYRIDRMLNHLYTAGLLRGIRGVVLGDMQHDVPKELQKKVSWKQVVADRFSDAGVPVLIGAPLGHGLKNEALPFGIHARITREGKLELLEQLVDS